jgi:hypothetical protein
MGDRGAIEFGFTGYLRVNRSTSIFAQLSFDAVNRLRFLSGSPSFLAKGFGHLGLKIALPIARKLGGHFAKQPCKHSNVSQACTCSDYSLMLR